MIERVEGKIAQPIVDETPHVDMNSVHWRFVASLYMYKNLPMAEALDYTDRHPEEVETWGREKGCLSGAASPTAAAEARLFARGGASCCRGTHGPSTPTSR